MMAKLGWYLRRLSKMSGREMVARGRDAAVKQAWRIPAWRPRPPTSWDRQPVGERFRLPPPEMLKQRVSERARRALLEQASKILAGEVIVLNHRSACLGEDPDWFTDVRTGRRAPDRAYCFDIRYRDPSAVGDIKYVWEPSRHHHLTILAAAYYFSGEQAFADRVARHLRSWWDRNEFLHGVQWTSGIELGIRLVSWVWLRRLLAGWRDVSGLFEDNPSFVRQLYQHQAYLAVLQSHGSSANNHLVAEVAGLFASACAFPLFAQSQAWRRLSARVLEREISLQIFADGLNRELATAYHGLTMELFLAAAVEDDGDRPALGESVWRGLAAMADALASMMDAGGRPPAQGDDDGGFALLVDGPGFDRWASLLDVCGRVVGRCDWWPATATGDLRAALLADRVGVRPRMRRRSRPIRHFVEGGMVLLRDLAPGNDEIWCRCDCGPVGFLSTAAHGHADALSVEVRHGGVDILCDPGTFCYHGHDDWRAYFRSTLAHNTLELDRVDQCRAGGLFFWLDDVRTTVEEVSGLDQGDVAECRAVHDGYRRLARPAVHRRRVRLDRGARRLDIWDSIESESGHEARLAFHLGPNVECLLDGATASLVWRVGDRSLRASMSLPTTLRWSLHRGERAPILGWYSSTFGLLEPSFVLLGEGVIASEDLHSRLDFAETPVDAGATARQSRAIRTARTDSYVE